MRVKIKLIAVMLFLAIIPIILINIISGNSLNNFALDIQVSHIVNILKNQADDLSYIFEEIISSSKQIVSSEHIKAFTLESNVSGVNSGNADVSIINSELNTLRYYNSSLQKAVIINNSGIIAASTDVNDIGKAMPDSDGLFALALENNGFSPFYMGSGDNPVPMFVVSKSIYSDENVRQGILYQSFSTVSLQKFINNIKLDSSTKIAVMDSSGHILEYPFKEVNSYSENTNFSGARDNISSILNNSASSPRNNITEIGTGNTNKMFYNAQVNNSDWTILSIIDQGGLSAVFSRNSAVLRNISILMMLIVSAAIIFFVILFTQPINDIIKVFMKKQRGDQTARFDITTKDEFRLIGKAFNSMFDDIYESEQRYRTIVEMTNNIIFEINLKKQTVFISKNFNKKFSFRPKDDTLEESFFYKLRIHKDDKDNFSNDLEKILGPVNFLQGEYRIKNVYGDFGWFMIKGTKFFDKDEIPTKIIGVIVDIDREKKSEMHLLQRASYDALTQLYNRETFLKSLTNELEMSIMKKSLDALMFIDLDDFKFFNDEYGHACGDEVLKFVADTLKEISFERGFTGRFGGDEFVICLTNLTLYGDSGKIAQEIIDILGKGFTFNHEGNPIKMTVRCSIGIAFLRESGKTTEKVIAAADEAMYNIKKHGKSAYAYAKSGNNTSNAAIEEIVASSSAIDSDAEKTSPVRKNKNSPEEAKSST